MWMPMTSLSEAALTRSPGHFRQHTDDPPGHIMVVDDNREAGTTLAALLELAHHTVEYIDNGRTALHAIEQHLPDLIILDVQLPDLDGFSICDVLKRNPSTWQIPPSRGCSAHSRSRVSAPTCTRGPTTNCSGSAGTRRTRVRTAA